MFQVIVSYLNGRYSCFFSEKPVEKYDDLIQRVKAAVPCIRNVPDSKIRVAYKDLKLGVFIAIAPQDNLVLHEVFTKAYNCGSATFRRLELEVRAIDSTSYPGLQAAGKDPGIVWSRAPTKISCPLGGRLG